jgi:hypothetical protein
MAPMLKYQDLVQAYSQRRLTNGNDILNGFTGIMKSFSELTNWEFLYGLPTALFDSAILFQRRDRQCQFYDIGFPSWSWSGWAEGSEPLMTPLPGIIYHEQYYVSTENEWYLVRAGDYVKINNSEVREPPLQWTTWRQSKISELAAVPCELTPREQERLLIFQASSTFMRVTSGPSWRTHWRSDDHSACTVALSADGQRQLTQIRELFDLSFSLEPEDAMTKVEFIVVASCTARHYSPYFKLGSTPKNPPEEQLILMAIKTNEKGISKRIDVAEQAVQLAEWLAYNPKWRTVFMM